MIQIENKPPHAVLAVPVTKQLNQRLQRFANAYHEHGGTLNEHQLRQACLDIGLQLMEQELFDAINETREGNEP